MCIVSVVTSAIGNQLPSLNQWPYQQIQDLSRVIQLLESIDRKMGAKDCLDETKRIFIEQLNQRLHAAEAFIHEQKIQKLQGMQTGL